MADFSPEEYFLKKTQDVDKTSGFTVGPRSRDKYEALSRASEEKHNKLNEIREYREALEQINQDSWVSKAGVDPDGVAATVINEAANTAVLANEHVLGADVPILRDYLRDKLKGSVHRLDMTKDRPVQDAVQLGAAAITDSVGSSIEGMSTLNEIFGDYTTAPLVNAITGGDAKTGNLGKELAKSQREAGEAYRQGMSLDSRRILAESTPEGDLTDPSTWTMGTDPTLRGYMMQGVQVLGSMAPVIAASLLTGGASAGVQSGTAMLAGAAQGGGAAVEQAHEAIDKMAKTKTSDGRLQIEVESPLYRDLLREGLKHSEAVERVKDEAGKWAFIMTAPGSAVGGALTQKLLSPASKILTGRGVAVQTTGRAGLGGLEESTQEVLEGVTAAAGTNLGAGTDLSLTEGSFGNAVLGALGGAPVSAAGGAASGANDALERREEKKAERRKEDAKQVRSIATGQLSGQADYNSSSYAPDRAITALMGHSKQPTTDAETKKQNFEQANTILADLENRRTGIVNTLNPEGSRKRNEETLAKLEAKLASADPENTELVGQLEAAIKDRKDLLAEPDAELDPKEAQALRQELSKIDRHLRDARSAMKAYRNEQAQGTDTNALIEQIKTSTDPEETAALGDQLIEVAGIAPDNLDSDAAAELAGDMNNGLRTDQRTYLNTFSAARAAENLLKSGNQVSKNIYTGTPEGYRGIQYTGIQQYQERFAEAAQSNNQVSADRQIADLSAFEADHRGKAEAAEAARPTAARILRVDGQWTVLPEDQEVPNLRALGGLTINKDSLVAQLRMEADALTKARAELEAAYALRFPEPAKAKGNEDVSNQSRKEEPRSTAPDNADPSEAEGTGSVADAASTPDEDTTAGTEPTGTPTEVITDESTTTDVPTEGTSQVAKATPEKGQKQSNESKPEAPTEEAVEATIDPVEDTDGQVNEGSDITEGDDAQTVIQPGTLSIMEDKSPEGTPFQDRSNLIADFFFQVKDATRPLLAVKDFLSKLISGKVKATSFLRDIDTLSVQQQALLEFFLGAAQAWQPIIQEGLNPKDRGRYRFDHLMQFFHLKDGDKVDLDENLYTAISAAALQFVLDNAVGRGSRTPREINELLGRDDDTPITDAEWELHGEVAFPQGTMIREMGRHIYQALGFVMVEDAPENLETDLINTLGAQAFRALVSVPDLLVREERATNTMVNLTEEQKAAADQTFALYIFDRNPTTRELTSEFAADAIKLNRGSSMILSQLFNMDAKVTMPSTKPSKFKQKRVKNGKMNVPGILARALDKANKQPWTIRQDISALYDKVGFDTFLEWIGLPERDPEHTQAANEKRYEAQSDLASLVLDRWLEHRETLALMPEGEGTPFFFRWVAYRNQRTGIIENGVNPQQYKAHRSMVTQPDWESEIDTNNDAQVAEFLVRVGESMGLKGSVDQILGGIAKAIADPELIAAMDAIESYLYDDADASEQTTQAITVGVKKLDKNLQGLDGLKALMQYRRTKRRHKEDPAKNRATFMTNLAGEVDGVSNGVIFSHWLLGAAATVSGLLKVLRKGGIYDAASGHTDFAEWNAVPGNYDMYQQTSADMLKNLTQIFGEFGDNPKLVNALWAVTGKLFEQDNSVTSSGRNFAKGVVPPIIFGSGVDRAIDGLREQFMQSIVDKLEKAASNSDASALRKYLEGINILIQTSDPDAKLVNVNASFTDLQKRFLTTKQWNAIGETFMTTLGRSMGNSIDYTYGSLRGGQRQLAGAGDFAFGLYDSVFNGLMAQARDSTADVARSATGKPLHDMNRKQRKALEARIKGLRPVMHSMFSKQEGDIDSGLLMARTEDRVPESDLYETQVTFGKKIPGTDNIGLRVKGQVPTDVSPGVLLATATTHSDDSFVSQRVNLPSLNMHDARVAGLSQIGQIAYQLNAGTWLAMTGYSPLEEAYQTLERQVRELDALMQSEDGLPEGVMDNLVASIRAHAKAFIKEGANGKTIWPTNGEILIGMLESAKAAAFEADTVRLGAALEVEVVNQYAYEGRGYEVTKTDKAKVQADLDALVDQIPEDLAEIAKRINQRLKAANSRHIQKLAEAKAAKEAAKNKPAETKTPKPAAKTQAKPESPAAQPRQEDQAWKDHALTSHSPAQLDAQLTKIAGNQSLSSFVRSLAQRVLDLARDSGESLRDTILNRLTDTQAARIIEAIGDVVRTTPVAEGISPYGPLGTRAGKRDSDPEMMKFIGDNVDADGNLNTRDMLKFLQDRFKAKGDRFNFELLSKLLPLVSDVRLGYITSKTPADFTARGRNGKLKSTNRGWYSPEENTVYVKSPEFVHGLITPEIFLHEYLHAALFQTLRQAQQRPDGSPQKQLYNELESIRKAAEKFVNGMSEADQKWFARMVKNVDELISYGLTDARFQKEVLSKINGFKALDSSNTFINGFDSMIRSILKFLFPNRKVETLTDGLSALVINASGMLSWETQRQAEENADPGADMDSEGDPELDTIDNFTMLEIHEALANEQSDPFFSQYLRTLLVTMTEKLHGPFGAFHQSMRKDAAKNPLSVWLKALETGQAPFASQAIYAGFEGSAQEDFAMEQIEATMRAAMDENESHTRIVYKQLYQLYKETQAKLPKDGQTFFKGDWSKASPEEKAEAKARYDFVFTTTLDANNRSNYLARFAALGLANKHFRDSLAFTTTQDTRQLADAKTVLEKLQTLLEQILTWFGNKVANTYLGQPADQKLVVLSQQLVEIENKRRTTLKANANRTRLFEPTEALLDEGTSKMRELAKDMLEAPIIKESSIGPVRLAGAVGRALVNKQINQYNKIVLEMRNKHAEGRFGLFSNVLNELGNIDTDFQVLNRATKQIEGLRKKTIATLTKFAGSTFSTIMSKEEKGSLTAVFMRTGLHALYGSFSMAQIEKLVSSKDARQEEIGKLERKLRSGIHKDTYAMMVTQARGLGYAVVTGIDRVPSQAKNAYNMARGYGTGLDMRLTEEQSQVVEGILDHLIPLYALDYSYTTDLANAANVLRSELARDDSGNGVEFMLSQMRRMEEDSLENLFDGNKALMEHGYTAEIYDPHVKVVSATADEAVRLIEEGYSEVGSIQIDPSDPDQEPRKLYALRGAGMQGYLSGAISTTGERHKGTGIHNGYLNTNDPVGLEAKQRMDRMNHDKARRMQKVVNADFDPRKETHNYTRPQVNGNGDVVNHVYLMQRRTKDQVLRRDNRFDHVMGAIAGSIYDKVASPEQNKKVVDALKAVYDEEFTKTPEAFTLVGEASTDPEMAEIWNLMPDKTQAAFQASTGMKGFYIRNDLIDITLGYRRLSASTMFARVQEERERLRGDKDYMKAGVEVLDSELQQLFVQMIETLLRMYAEYKGYPNPDLYVKRATVMIARGERAWQELVREVKDIVVIKTGVVAWGNFLSNLWLLSLRGALNPHHLAVGFKGAIAFTKDSEELRAIELQLASGYTLGKEAELRNRAAELKDGLERNPVKVLMDAGLMPTIVEDLAADDDPYSFKTALGEKYEQWAGKVPKFARQAGEFAYMKQDSTLYQGFTRATQLGDFVARYALYQHLISRAKNPLSQAEAIQQASEDFVNYDIPMHKGLQYVDDMGLVPFTKYFLRIQRPLLRIAEEHPGRLLAVMALGNFVDLGPIVLDSSIVARLDYNPLRWGAGELPMVIGDILPISLATGLLD